MADRYIVIPKWDGPDGFQHYKNRDPIWIKAYTRLLSDQAFLDLTYHQRGLLLSIWLEYARSNRQLRDGNATTTRQTRDSHVTLTRQLGHRVTTRDLEALNHAGFIEFSASAPLAECKQDASLDKEVEKKRPSTSNGATPAPAAPKPLRCTGCTLTFTRERDLRDHLDNVHWLEGDTLDQAVAQALREASGP
jgi:hypothetical protein